MDYLSRIHRRAEGKEKHVPNRFQDKEYARNFAIYIGCSVPDLYGSWEDPENIDFGRLPKEFILKPTFLSSSIGVQALEKQASGEVFLDHLRNSKEFTKEEVVDFQKGMALKKKSTRKPPRWIAEERVVDATGRAVPDDWKFFAFQGEIGLIERIVRRGPGKRNKIAFFDSDFRPIVDEDDKLIGSNPKYTEKFSCLAPDNAEQLLKLARRISVAIPTPFVRVDLYNSVRGPIFGEATLVPGSFFYGDHETLSDELNYRLGFLWEAAEKKL
ncbi:hypothetical protein M0E84_10735 [Corynebacterium sp. CCM 9186]|uniref:ATP-grasp fold amidoligase family protein n=1 Tax=Corynebacterium meridianum TaxID=2765363 RepID=UPI0020056214|nr:ATP-grasp fold amidoligase family protein [Corynebacterium meridianum]MCK7678499.1 hypothetical protein [Corynebacterium meridianum]